MKIASKLLIMIRLILTLGTLGYCHNVVSLCLFTDWASYIISIPQTNSNKIGGLIHSMTFLSPEVALYFYKSTIWPCMEYCFDVWAGASSCYLELLGKLQKKVTCCLS